MNVLLAQNVKKSVHVQNIFENTNQKSFAQSSEKQMNMEF